MLTLLEPDLIDCAGFHKFRRGIAAPAENVNGIRGFFNGHRPAALAPSISFVWNVFPIRYRFCSFLFNLMRRVLMESL